MANGATEGTAFGNKSVATRPRQAHGENVLFAVRGVWKTFGGATALADVDLELNAGETHALVGHNGSGKSTLIKIISGFHRPDEPVDCYFDGRNLPIHQLRKSGVNLSIVHQDLGLIPELSAAENLAIQGGFVTSKWGAVQWKEQARRAEALIEPFGIELNVAEPVGRMSAIDRAVIALGAALQGWDTGRGLLMLDEPTALLPRNEVTRLHAVLERLRVQGAAILYVTHRLDDAIGEADRISVLRSGRNVTHRLDDAIAEADRISVLRGGQNMRTLNARSRSKTTLVEVMVGSKLGERTEGSRGRSDQRVSATAISVEGLTGLGVRDLSFRVGVGEIVGFVGLAGSGAADIPRLLTDRRRFARRGGVSISGQRSCRVARFKGEGLALVPPDRRAQGIVADMSVGENLQLSILRKAGKVFRGESWLRSNDTQIANIIRELQIEPDDPSLPIGSLSGGNQQKVVIGRALLANPAVLLLSEPTAGVDVEARRAIRELVWQQAAAGLGVLLVSSDLEDLILMSDRVLVMCDGVVQSEVDRSDLTDALLIELMEEPSGAFA